MTAPNHALTGAAIGLTVTNPLLAMPLAFLSHFVCDAIPHYDPPGTGSNRMNSRRFIREMLVFGAGVSFMIVLLLALNRPAHWLVAAVCAFLAASPDLFWIPRFIHSLRHGHDRGPTNPFLRMHAELQWKTGPRLWWVELIWFGLFGSFLLAHL